MFHLPTSKKVPSLRVDQFHSARVSQHVLSLHTHVAWGDGSIVPVHVSFCCFQDSFYVIMRLWTEFLEMCLAPSMK
jgi:hypothetical protein